MANTIPKKSVLQSAAAESYSKAGPEMKRAEPPLAKPVVSGSKAPDTGRATGKARKSR